MPVEVKTLQEAQRPLADRVLEFLKAGKGKAFTVAEVYAGVEGFSDSAIAMAALLAAATSPRDSPFEQHRRALEELVARGDVASGEYRNQTYYYARSS